MHQLVLWSAQQSTMGLLQAHHAAAALQCWIDAQELQHNTTIMVQWLTQLLQLTQPLQLCHTE
jgi:hypothetical protein